MNNETKSNLILDKFEETIKTLIKSNGNAYVVSQIQNKLFDNTEPVPAVEYGDYLIKTFQSMINILNQNFDKNDVIESFNFMSLYLKSIKLNNPCSDKLTELTNSCQKSGKTDNFDTEELCSEIDNLCLELEEFLDSSNSIEIKQSHRISTFLKFGYALTQPTKTTLSNFEAIVKKEIASETKSFKDEIAKTEQKQVLNRFANRHCKVK